MTAKPKIFAGKGRIATEILGRNKYTNYKQALNEAVANSLDARAKDIKIKIEKEFIEVLDNGIGMSESDLKDRYFTLGERNPDPEARALFGIGVCANAALGNILIVHTRPKGRNAGMRAVVNFDKVESVPIGQYQPEEWEKIDFQNREFSTSIRVEKLRWNRIDTDEIRKFLIEKHWPLLVDRSIKTQIYVNGKLLKAAEPQNVEKFEFTSQQEFKINGKNVPPQRLECGRVEGVFYLKESGFKEPSIDVYVKSQRIDKYSGDQIDWLKIKLLRSPEGFKSRLKGIIKVEATDEVGYRRRGPFERNILQLKSDRSGFFEDCEAFRHLCAYLNEKGKGKTLKLPYGGILRLINSEWYRRRGADISKTQELIQQLEPGLKKELQEIFEDEELRTEPQGDMERRRKKEPQEETKYQSENRMFRCPKCQNILRVKIAICDKWLKSSPEKRKAMRERHWKCDTCGFILDPEKDKYRRGPIRGREIMQVHLEEGLLTRILADKIGKAGPRSLYLPEDSAVTINAEHSMCVYSIKTSDESFKCYLLDSIIYAIAARRSKDSGEGFEHLYNDLSSKISRVIDIDDYEEALDRLRISRKNGE